jgi:predicted ATPase
MSRHYIACSASGRLVCVVGRGGVGKTRVALEVAARSGTVAVLLLPRSPSRAPLGHALASALNLRVA